MAWPQSHFSPHLLAPRVSDIHKNLLTLELTLTFEHALPWVSHPLAIPQLHLLSSSQVRETSHSLKLSSSVEPSLAWADLGSTSVFPCSRVMYFTIYIHIFLTRQVNNWSVYFWHNWSKLDKIMWPELLRWFWICLCLIDTFMKLKSSYHLTNASKSMNSLLLAYVMSWVLTSYRLQKLTNILTNAWRGDFSVY